jgi:hypothetical protein
LRPKEHFFFARADDYFKEPGTSLMDQQRRFKCLLAVKEKGLFFFNRKNKIRQDSLLGALRGGRAYRHSRWCEAMTRERKHWGK